VPLATRVAGARQALQRLGAMGGSARTRRNDVIVQVLLN
jgi:hypothetical protein